MSGPTPMFVLISEYQASIAEVEAVLPRHSEWVTAGYREGRILVSGRRQPPQGGLIVAAGLDRADVEHWLAGDPFVVAAVAVYRIEQFGATDFPKRSPAFDLFRREDDADHGGGR
ncbi:MAG TPA: YciI family protein [Solirubrobacterales bacterium]